MSGYHGRETEATSVLPPESHNKTGKLLEGAKEEIWKSRCRAGPGDWGGLGGPGPDCRVSSSSRKHEQGTQNVRASWPLQLSPTLVMKHPASYVTAATVTAKAMGVPQGIAAPTGRKDRFRP
jgi:hypothetical protein